MAHRHKCSSLGLKVECYIQAALTRHNHCPAWCELLRLYVEWHQQTNHHLVAVVHWFAADPFCCINILYHWLELYMILVQLLLIQQLVSRSSDQVVLCELLLQTLMHKWTSTMVVMASWNLFVAADSLHICIDIILWL